MIWAARDPGAKGYQFNYEALKGGNEDVQVRSDWLLPICTGGERSRMRRAASCTRRRSRKRSSPA